MESSAVYDGGVRIGKGRNIPLIGTDEQDNKSSCRLGWLLKGGTMRWTSKIQNNKEKMCTTKEFVKRTCRLEVSVKDRHRKQTVGKGLF